MAEENKPEQVPEKPKKVSASGGKVAVVLIRNITGASGSVKDTLNMLRLHKKLTCTVWDKTDVMMGMMNKVKDYVTYGEIDADTLKELEEKRGQKDSEGKLRKDFHLHPPRGGFERKGIKHSFTQGGVVGYRAGAINALIKRML